jgi:hypothetical protein
LLQSVDFSATSPTAVKILPRGVQNPSLYVNFKQGPASSTDLLEDETRL